MKVGIMQPYFLAYEGYFQLIEHVDHFIIYDNIEYTKRGWINRNRMLRNGTTATFSLPIKSASDTLDVDERQLAANFDRKKLSRQIEHAYSKAEFAGELSTLIDTIMSEQSENLFEFIHSSVRSVCASLGISTPITPSSQLGVDRGMRGRDRVIETCRILGCSAYVNPIGGVGLYDEGTFKAAGIELQFLKSKLTPYSQTSPKFEPALSIIDPIAFLGIEKASERVRRDFRILSWTEAANEAV